MRRPELSIPACPLFLLLWGGGGGGAGRQVIGTDRSVHEPSDRNLRELNMRVCYSDHTPTHVEEHKL